MHIQNWSKLSSRTMSILLLLVTGLSILGAVLSSPTPVVEANQNCTNATATTPTWNPFPLNLNDPNPQPNGNCTDIPMISHWPIQSGNPRTRSYNINETVTVHLYYNNGARTDATNNILQNPRARLDLQRESTTQYRLRSFLSGSAGDVNSSQTQYGGDIIINVPAGTELEEIRRNTLWYPQAPQRFTNFNAGQNVQTNLNIDSNPPAANPLLSPNGFTIYTPTPSTISQQESAGLRAGFDESGYFLTAWRVNPIAAPVNNPPIVPGQEITIIRGDSGQFQPVQGTDPDNDYPLTYQPNDLPSFCSWDANTRIVNCQTNSQTPARSTFTITPTDSRGLVGTPGTFIVNVIEPGLNLTKVCVKTGTQTPCSNAELKPGDSVTYTLNVSNTGSAPARNVVVDDNYDETLLRDVRDINPQGTLNTSNGTIRWSLGNLNSNQSVSISYTATVAATASNGSVVINTATATADGVPPRQASTNFPIGVNLPLLSQSDKVCFKKGTGTACNAKPLSIGDQVTYYVNVRNTGNAPATNVVVVDTYDKARLNTIVNIQPAGTLDNQAGTIRWELGTVNPGETKTVSFDATVATSVVNGDVIINRARITADNLPPRDVQVDFPIGIPPTVRELDRTGGVTVFMTLLGLLIIGAGFYYYNKTRLKTAAAFTPARSTELTHPTTHTEVEKSHKIDKSGSSHKTHHHHKDKK